MKKWTMRIGRWGVYTYIVQAVVGIVLGIYIAAAYPELIQEVVSCVAY